MIIKDNVKNFKKFLETCYTGSLFGEFYTKLEGDSFNVVLVSVTKSCGVKIKYTPREVIIDHSLDKKSGSGKKEKIIYEDGEFWCNPNRILDKMDKMNSGDVVVTFDGEKVLVVCERRRFLSEVFADRDPLITELENPSNAYSITESIEYDAEGNMNFSILEETVLDHKIVLDSIEIGYLEGSRKKLSTASNYRFSIRDSMLEISVDDLDDKSGKPQYFTTEFPNVEGYKDGDDFECLFMVGVSEMFGNLPGEVDLYLGNNINWPFVLRKTFIDNIKDGKESVSRLFMEVSYMNMPYDNPEPVESGEDLQNALNKTDDDDTNEEFENDDLLGEDVSEDGDWGE